MSHQERDLEIGRLLREHSERRCEYAALSAKLNRIGTSLQGAAKSLVSVDGICSQNAETAKTHLHAVMNEADPAALSRLLDEYIQLAQTLQIDLNTLREYGVGK